MNGKDLLISLGDINPRYYEEAEQDALTERQTHRTLRRPLLVAAIVALILLLVGCAVVYVLSMQEIWIGEQEIYQDVFAYDPDTGEAIEYIGQETITEQVLTLAGLKGSPNYLAAMEWFAFKKEYDPDHSIISQLNREGLVPKFPAEYEYYNIYSQEMKDKLDEILDKYSLKPIGSTVPFRTEEVTCRALGLEDIVVPGSDAVMELDYAAYQECGNLDMNFNLIIPGDSQNQDQETRCHIYYMRKDAFTDDVISLAEIESWKEWTYATESGAEVLIFRSPNDWRGYMFCDMPNYTVTLQFTFIDEQYSQNAAGVVTVDREVMTDRQIERLADAIDFSIEPHLTEGWELLAEQTAGSGEEIDGFSIELKDVKSDGNNAFITLRITAPEEIDLMEHEGEPIMLKHSNRWGFFEPVSDVSGNVSGGYTMEDDGDGKSNTRNVVLEYTAGTEHRKEGEIPFSSGTVWNVYWQDIYGSYWDEEVDEPKKFLLMEGTWSFDVVFENVITEELELIEEPIPSRASYGWDLKGNDVYQDTMITSFILRPMSATIVCDMKDVAPDFLTVGDRCIYVMMQDGSKIALYGDNGGGGIQNLKPEHNIDLSQVVSVLMPDGTEIDIPETYIEMGLRFCRPICLDK